MFTSNRTNDGHIHLYETSANTTADNQLLLRSDADDIPMSWSPDSTSVLFLRFKTTARATVWLLSVADRQAKPLLESQAFDYGSAEFSPNGRFIAYDSNESGRNEVYVQTFPPSGQKWVISNGGGSLPLWRRDGKELFYLTQDGKVMSAEMKSDSTFDSVVTKQLFQTQFKRAPGIPYAVTNDGSRFLINTPAEANTATPLVVVLNWTATLKAKE
jgi:Tol biopolymer transport system component